MKAFQESLIHDLTPEDFADMYAQTITYGLLSSRIVDPKNKSVDGLTAHMRLSPFLKELMATFLEVNGRKAGTSIDFDELGVGDVVELLDRSNMEAVVADFGDKNAREDPVMHFFEGFLEAYNKEIKRSRGVFYTPQPVVSYIVRSVHELLQTEFGLADGLADTTTWGEMLIKHPGLKLPPLTDELGEKLTISPDEPFVQILDPATGTATFLVEVIEVIHSTLARKWKQQRLTDAQQLDAWNDYVPQHLLPRLHAFELMMAPYAIAHMKIGLKLAETGYLFGSEERARIYLTNALEPWTQQLPLTGFDALSHEATAVNQVKQSKRFTVVIGNPPYSGHSANKGRWIEGLVDDYSQISGTPLKEANSKWLRDDYVKFLRFGQELMRVSGAGLLSFITNHGYIDNPTFRGMRASILSDFLRIWITDLHGNTKKQERDDSGDRDKNVFDIQQGVAVLAAIFGHADKPQVRHGHVRGDRSSKYDRLRKESAVSLADTSVRPEPPFYLLIPQDLTAVREYEDFLNVAQSTQQASLGILTKRDSLVIAFSQDELLAKLSSFAMLSRTDSEVAEEFGVPLNDNDKWNVSAARASLSSVDENKIKQLLYRPFDKRFVYYDDALVARTNRRVLKHLESRGNLALILGRQGMAIGSEEWDVCFVCDGLVDQNIYRRGGGTVFPLRIAGDEHGLGLDDLETNWSREFLGTFVNLKASPEDVFYYSYAVFNSPSYRNRSAELLKIDYPRLPPTENVELFSTLASLGGILANTHLMSSPNLVNLITEFRGVQNPVVEKIIWSNNAVWIDMAMENCFVGVRQDVWEFHVGGHQICEKWLKDRKGRTLSDDDIAHYQKIVVALSETIRLMKEIDEVIEHHGGWPGAFSGAKAAN
jgi:predicted helicase